MKKVFLYAYDKVNLGDDLFIRTIVRRYPHVQFYMWSDKRNKVVFKDESNLKIFNKNSGFIRYLKKIRPSLVVRYQEGKKKKCDAVVYIGGSIFMEYPSWENAVNWWEYQVEQYPFYVVGANFGPYETDEYRKKMGSVFEKMEDVCFRDKYSLKLFENCDRVRYAPDILFSYPMPEKREEKNQIFISVINCEKKEDGKYRQYQDSYEKMILDLAINSIEKGMKILFVSFCQEEGDEETVKKLAKKLLDSGYTTGVECCFYDGTNEKEVLGQLMTSQYVVASRFHAIVLSLAGGKRVYPILYSKKGKNMLDDIGFCGKYIEIDKNSVYKEGNVYDNIISIREECIEKLVKESSAHFTVVDKKYL